MRTSTIGMLALAFCCAAGGADAGQRYRLQENRLQAFDEQEVVRWEVMLREPAKRLSTLPDGSVRLDNGKTFDPRGHQQPAADSRRGTSTKTTSASAAIGAAGWEPAIDLFSPFPANSTHAAGPAFLPDGSACALEWVPLAINCSQGSQTWTGEQSLEALRRDGVPFISDANLVIDHAGNITVLYRVQISLGGGNSDNQLHAIRRPVDGSWQPSQQIYSSGNLLFQNIQVAVDNSDNVVVLLDPNFGAESVVYSATKQAWQPKQRVKLPGLQDAINLSLAGNRSGSRIAAAYIKYGARNPGVYAGFFDSQKLKFSPARKIPGTDIATWVGEGPNLRLPITVDEMGNVYALVQFEDPKGDESKNAGLWGLRYENGQWANPDALVAGVPSGVEDVALYGALMPLKGGGALGSDVVFSSQPSPRDTLHTFRHVLAAGWVSATPYEIERPFGIGWTRVSGLGNDQGAVVIDSGGQYTLFDGQSWSGLLTTGQILFYNGGLGLHPDGSSVLIEGGVTETGTRATWLRP